jgi:CRISPR/Cas system type I-B associated protein Csh2 (Cas7 group RAMP superfamily)
MMIAAWLGTNNLSTTSKYGQTSRLLARIIYSDEKAYIGDVARGVSIAKKEGIEDISEAGLDISGFLSTLSTNKSKIDEVQFAVHDALSVLDGSNAKQFLVNYLSGNKIKYKDILAS